MPRLTGLAAAAALALALPALPALADGDRRERSWYEAHPGHWTWQDRSGAWRGNPHWRRHWHQPRHWRGRLLPPRAWHGPRWHRDWRWRPLPGRHRPLHARHWRGNWWLPGSVGGAVLGSVLTDTFLSGGSNCAGCTRHEAGRPSRHIISCYRVERGRHGRELRVQLPASECRRR